MHPRKPPAPTAVMTPLEIYFKEINRTPLLSAEEERELARRIQAGDQEARDLMVRANLRLVVRLASRYVQRGCNLEDLIAEGNVGLVKAADRYDPARNTRFSTYAFYWIRLSLQQVINTLRTIRLSNHMAVLVSKWSRTAAVLRNQLGRLPTELEVARRLGLPAERIPAVTHALHIVRMDLRSLDSEGEISLGDCLLDARAQAPESAATEGETRTHLASLLEGLSEREAQIVRLRFGMDGEEAHTLQAIALRLGITRERVRQLESRALGKLRTQAEAVRRACAGHE